MKREPHSLAICDANVLIDYFIADEDLIRELVKYWKTVYVPDVVLNEVKATSQKRAEELGLTILETPLILPEAKRLSFQDRACLHFVVQNHWVCIANDVRLRKECEAQGEVIVWGLEMLVILVECSQITRERAVACAQKIHNANPAITDGVFAQFMKKLEDRIK